MGSYLFLGVILLGSSLWAADELKPEPLPHAVQEYKTFWQTNKVSPANHEVWKLYIYYPLFYTNGFGNKNPELLVAGLTPNPKDGYTVELRVNQLYNFLRPIPQKGDVIVMEGHVQQILRDYITGPKKNWVLNCLYMYVEDAVTLPNEHFDPYPPSPSVPAQ
jgi:hypothetical protein